MGTCVYVGIMDDGSEVAVKRMLIQASEGTAENEREIFNLIDTKKSPFIVSYRHFLQDKMFMYLIVDLCEEALNDHVHSQSKEQLHENGRRMIREILTGLKFLHDEGILHRDLKPSNVLVDVEGHMRLADFGISRVLNEDETTVQTNAKGTHGWMPAEVIETFNQGGKGGFKKKSDVQVAGMIAYFILSKGEHPFGPPHDRMSNILKGNPVFLEKLSDLDGQKFIAKMIRHKITDRPYAYEALGDTYINKEIKCRQTSKLLHHESDGNHTSDKVKEQFQPPSSTISCHDDKDHRDEDKNDQFEYNDNEGYDDDDYDDDDDDNNDDDDDYYNDDNYDYNNHEDDDDDDDDNDDDIEVDDYEADDADDADDYNYNDHEDDDDDDDFDYNGHGHEDDDDSDDYLHNELPSSDDQCYSDDEIDRMDEY